MWGNKLAERMNPWSPRINRMRLACPLFHSSNNERKGIQTLGLACTSMHVYRPSVHCPLQSNNPFDDSSSSAWDTRPRLFGPSLIFPHPPAFSQIYQSILHPEDDHNSARTCTHVVVKLQSPKRSQDTIMLPTIPLYRRFFCGVKPNRRPNSDVSLTQHKSAGVCVREHTRVDTRAARAHRTSALVQPVQWV